MNYVIDAKGKKIGRIATEIATVLMGKNKADYKPNVAPSVQVVIENAGLLDISEKKKLEKVYTRHSGYPGGLKVETLGDILNKKGAEEVLRKAVYGMLPANKLRKIMLSNLTVKN